MKKQLLLGSVLLLAVSGFSQTERKAKIAGAFNIKKAQTVNINESDAPRKLNINPVVVTDVNPSSAKASDIQSPPTNISWNLIAGSRNTYGMVISQTRPLQYNDNLNAVSFIHRCSFSYAGMPANNSGVIVAQISTNWGTNWDSTCLYSDASIVGRFPQGGLYNPVGNTNIANAYAVATGPSTDGGTNWMGNFYASKQLGAANYNATASPVPNAMQVFSNQTATYSPTAFGPQLFSYGFSATDDGVMHAIVPVFTTQQTDVRNIKIVKGTFNAGVFNWTTDSLTPPVLIESTGGFALSNRPIMAWNEAGTVGYALLNGALNTATASNRGYQPIVYKTTNSGTTWALVPGIDFNSAAMAPLLNKLAGVNSNSNLAIPYFGSEGFDCVVDANNKLHIVGLLRSTFDLSVDSIGFVSSFTTVIGGAGDSYAWGHIPGDRPYLYDFMGDGSSAWTHKTIDSLSSEGPSQQGAAASTSGFNDNPWNIDAGNKIEIDSRIQVGRTPNGQFITYSWAESDSVDFTGPLQKKWNVNPNIKTRCLNVSTGSLSITEVNVTKYPVAQGVNNPNVRNRATLHYMSPTTGAAIILNGSSSSTVDIKTPFTVTNSNPYSQLTNNTTWYSTNTLSYVFTGTTTVGFIDNATTSASSSIIYPNPTKNNATLAIDVKDNVTVTINVYSLVGALVKTTTANAIVGQNNINIDLSNLTAGIYMAKVNVGNVTSTKKLIIE